ncbi:peptidase S10 [Shewanella mangrovi]|uniref:Peptidase S10 n=1 Tax=Shewanella mangrovi TaxID=1515746 RepID=A0A094JHU6_9GAMM|nr:peptidase S10 [Shewanella mangrovi]KFZ38772.1 peptidase S10 [Shewanella mangrovi]
MKKLLLIGCLLSNFPLLADTPKSPDATPSLDIPQLQSFATQHKGKFHGETINYTATVSNMHLTNDKGEVIGDAVTTAYVADSSKNRPVTFVFNGGPGSASIWLHMGLFGPKIVQVPSDAKDAGNAPFKLIDNPLSPLDKTDLVFIDPIGTGFSQLAGKGKAEDVWGMAEDAKSVSQIVKNWVAQNNRWNSAKYIAGESYGTTRAAAMQPYLDDSSNPIRMNGLILISQALDYQGSTPTNDNLISFVTYLPTEAATAWYHHKIDQSTISLPTLIAQAKSFAVDTYLPALFKGSALPKAEFDAVAEKLAYFTGLPLPLIKKANLRVPANRHVKLLLADEGLTVGRLDSRYQNDELDDLEVKPRYDAASVAISAAYNAALNHYFASDLAVKWSRQYVVSSREVTKNWVYDRRLGKEPMYVNSAHALSEEMRKNPSMKILLASGYFDYSTPFFDGEYTFGRYGIDLSRVTRTYYQAGHMMYLHQPDFEQLAQDIHQFYQQP